MTKIGYKAVAQIDDKFYSFFYQLNIYRNLSYRNVEYFIDKWVDINELGGVKKLEPMFVFDNLGDALNFMHEYKTDSIYHRALFQCEYEESTSKVKGTEIKGTAFADKVKLLGKTD